MNPEVGAILHGRYEILGEVAQGGVSTVYEARDLLLGGTLALKRLLFVNDETRRAFAQEARLLAGLSHHGFPKVIDLFDEDGEDYLVMEFIAGPELETVARERGRALSFREVAGWADQILEALVYLHSCQPPIIHRDIKPSNLKLTPHGRVYLIDFGLAKRHDRSHSRPGYTESYAPLEQLRRQGTDQASDMYSLGATLYRLLSGRVPESALIRLEARLREAPDPLPPIDAINRTVPASFARALERTLALEREARLGSAEELRRLLHTAMSEALSNKAPMSGALAHPFLDGKEAGEPGVDQPTLTDPADLRPAESNLVESLSAESVSAGSVSAGSGPVESASGGAAPVEPVPAVPAVPAPVDAATHASSHRMKSTMQIPRPEVADLLSLGVLPDAGEQTTRLAEKLQAIVESTPSFREASRRRLVRGFPMGDGVVLAFFEAEDLSLGVALEVARAWRLDPALSGFGVRMGMVSAVLPREAATVSDARMGNPGLQRAREVMRMAKAEQILLPVERMDSLRRLSGTAKGLVLLGERLLSDQSRLQLCAWYFRPPAVEPVDYDHKTEREDVNTTGKNVVNTARIVLPPKLEAPASINTSPLAPLPAPLPAPPSEPLPALPREEAIFTPPAPEPAPEPAPAPAPAPEPVIFAPPPGGAAEIVWADAEEAAETHGEDSTGERRSGRGKFWLMLFLVVVLGAVAAIWRPWEMLRGPVADAPPPVQIEFVSIRGGTFMMGANDREEDEIPAHQVRLTQDFEIGKFEVTQSQWKQVMDGANPSRLQGDTLPVTNVSWTEATRFAERLTALMSDRYIYRLPTEAEWEYCARAGSSEQEAANLINIAHFGQTDGGPRAVGGRTSNLWSIHDLLGNVFEWCQDNYSARAYENPARDDPAGPAAPDAETGRVIRGGGWRSKADRCRPGYRGYIPPDKSNDETGLRVVRVKR